ncbi:prepilin peptidase [Tenebrionicola larvae]|jgi:prepilin signal peptidase PulO-like enzyme (type II secretory pathway)|uniref:prepilin peptidase n=1 Tax=Tenebrionicola larvae TaxID=2815733 RepID=UPI00201F4BBE|nr:A24 family peptidase [Tenebrionicola larvae]
MVMWLTGMFALGLIAGSVLNCVIWRLPVMVNRQLAPADTIPQDGLPARFNLFLPRSCCPRCHHTIAFYDNIPLISWVLLRGRCRRCARRISWRYPLVELATALCTEWVAFAWPPGLQALMLALCCWLLIALACIDLEHMLLPDVLTLSLLWLGLLANLQGNIVPLADAVIGAMAGWLALWGVYQVFLLFTGREGLGYGDFKLLAALGAWCGWQALPALLLCASISGLVWMGGLRLAGRIQRAQAFPFGPSLALAGWWFIAAPGVG